MICSSVCLLCFIVWRLRTLEGENAELKKLLADAMLDNAALKDLLAKKMVHQPATLAALAG
jgi:hypothetical protein